MSVILALPALLALACGPGADTGGDLREIAGPPPELAVCRAETRCEDGLCWTTLCGGTYWMGSPQGQGEASEHPRHRVAVRSFEMLRSEVTVAQYIPCVEDGACRPLPETEEIPERCNWGEPGFEEHPANCLTWQMAWDFCAWAGGALPSEAQWEYAARSRGQDVQYPWGDEEPSCDLAVLAEEDCCGAGRTWPVCSRPAGDTAQGLCDMAGNAFEWVEDWYNASYLGSPRTAEPWEHWSWDLRVLRGGGIGSTVGYRVRQRTFHDPAFFYSGMGARCVREHPEE